MNKELDKSISEIVGTQLKTTKQLSEALKPMYKRNDDFNKAISESMKTISLALKKISYDSTEITNNLSVGLSSMLPKLESLHIEFPKLEIPKINIPKIEIPEGFIKGLESVRCIMLYRQTEWPLYFMEDEELKLAIRNQHFDEINAKDTMKTIAINFFDTYGVESFLLKWESCSSLFSKRQDVLEEAISLYGGGYYYGCVSILITLAYGMISEIYTEMTNAGVEFNPEVYEYLYERLNNGKTLKKRDSVFKRIRDNDVELEKNQLICLASEIDEGVLFWDSVLQYVYCILLSSEDEMKDSNHPCRHKICHGVQLNYGTKEHALKAMLLIDILFNLGDTLLRMGKAD